MPFTHTSIDIDKAHVVFNDTRCKILVTAVNDSYVRAVSALGQVDAIVLSRGQTNTEYVIYPNSFGSWEVLSSNGTDVKSSLLEVDTIKVYEIDFTDPNQI